MTDYIDTGGLVDEDDLESKKGKRQNNGVRFEPVGTYRDPATIPRRKWLYSKQYIVGHVRTTIADGGIGKTNLSIAEGIALATGRNIANVLYWNGEEPIDDRAARSRCLSEVRDRPSGE